MQKRFKPLLAAAVAAGAIPLFDNVATVDAAPITAAAFGFDSFTSTAATQGSVSFAADSFSPGYGGSLTATLTNSTAFGWAFSTGNASTHGLSGTGWPSGGSYNFIFDIDDLNQMVIRFDMRSSNSGPGRFIVQSSTNGVTFSDVGTANVTTTNFASSSSVTAVSFSFSMPGSFSDTAPGVAGQTAMIRLLGQTSPAANSSVVSITGANAIDNVFITGQQVPEPTAMVMTLAAAAGLVSRPKRRDD